MPEKAILDLNLNYGHKNLTAAFRWTSASIGSILIVAAVLGMVHHSMDQFWMGVNSLLNLGFGIVMLVLSSRRLPTGSRKYFIISNKAVFYKTAIFKLRKKFLWDKVEAVELSTSALKIRIEDENKVRVISLLSVSYQDYELLQKAIVELCMERDIDLV